MTRRRRGHGDPSPWPQRARASAHPGQKRVERLELERGGHWRWVEHGPNGVYGFEGRYREVTPPARFVRSFEWDGMPAHVAIETVTLEDLGDRRTRIVILMQMHTPEERDGFLQSGMQQGMDAAFAQLDGLVSKS